MTSLNRDVRFTPKSGHWNRHEYHLRRSNSGSFAILAAIRRVSSLVSSLAAERLGEGESFQVRPSSVVLSHVAPQSGQAVNALIFCFLSASISLRDL
jgi:hypothetical protein